MACRWVRTDQRSKIRTFNIAPTWTHLVNPNTVFTLGGFVRQDQYNYYPSGNPFADFIPGSAIADASGRIARLTNLGAARGCVVREGHPQHQGRNRLSGHDSDGERRVRDCRSDLQPSASTTVPRIQLTIPTCWRCSQSGFDPLLAVSTRPDVARRRTAVRAHAAYTFRGHANIRELALFFQDTITLKNWTFNLGVRFDHYDGITSANQVEPRLGIAYNIKPTNTVLRISYARTLETPFNENLVLASVGCNDPVVNDLMATVQGYPCLTAPLRPGWRNEFHAGLQQAFGKYLVIDAEYIWKYTHLAYDFSVLGNTPITFPIEWASSKIPGYAVRASMPNFHGLSAFVVLSSVAARFFGPQVSGIGSDAGRSKAGTRVPHRSRREFQLNHSPAISAVDQGAVARLQLALRQRAGGRPGAVRGRQLRERAEWRRFHCGCFRSDARSAVPSRSVLRRRVCDADHADQSDGALCLRRNMDRTWSRFRRAGTEDDDHNPPRIASRNLFDIAVGHDNIFHGDKYKWSARLAVVNLTNKDALYNFLSTFSGTHYVTPADGDGDDRVPLLEGFHQFTRSRTVRAWRLLAMNS